MTTTTHTDKAVAVARETGWDLDGHAADREWTAVGLGPVGRHRDSEALDRSNFDVIYADLRERFGDAVDVASFGHWAVGWVEEISWDAGRADVRDAVEKWEATLADYPVADEMAFSELEYEEACQCIADSLSAYVEIDGQEYELVALKPEPVAEMAAEIFSWLFDRYSRSSAGEMRESEILEAALALGFYRPEA